MDRKHLISSLQSSAADNHEPTPFCPDDDDIAAFIDRSLDDSERILIERHLPDCQACVTRVGRLTRLLRETEENNTSPVYASKSAWRQNAPQWAVAATVVIAIGLLAWPPAIDQSEGYATVRSVTPVLAAPEILAPSSGIIGERAGFVIRWTEVPGSLYYEIRVVTDAGDLLQEARVESTEWTIGDDLGLEPGREYFIRVDAYLSDSQTIRSEHMPFRLKD